MRQQLVLVGLVTFGISCGGTGGNKEGEPPAPSQAEAGPPASLGLRTDVGFDPLSYLRPNSGECLQQQDSLQLPLQAKPIVIDGSFSDWVSPAGNLSDPAGDAIDGFDLTSWKIAASGDDVVLAVAYKVPVDGSLNLEFGGGAVVKNAVRRDLRRLFRVSDGALQQFHNGQWEGVRTEFGVVASGVDGTEIWLSRRLLGDVVTWPLWWVRLFTRDERVGQIMDSTAAAYFPSMLATDQPTFKVGRCVHWASSVGGVDVSEISTSPGDSGAPFFGLVRLALDRVQSILSRPLPMSHLAILVATADLPEMSQSTGIDPSYTGDGGGNALGSAGLAGVYRGLLVDARRFRADRLDDFPEGAFFVETAGQLLDLGLRDIFPRAPILVEQALRQALLDVLVPQQLGKSYWLDSIRPGVAAFLAASTQEQAVPLPSAAADSASGRTKAVAFGHLLGNELGPAQLLAVWSAAATAAAADTISGIDAFKAALVASCGNDAAKCDRLSSLLHGWLDAAAFVAPFTAAALDDDDLDGLPNFLEARLGTDPKRADSDGDGWTDMAEWLAGTDPQNAGSHPQSIIADGDFSDWQELLPKRLAVVNTSSGQCPKAAAIEFYAALATPTDLLFGAVASDFWVDEPAARWEIAVDLPKQNRQVLLTSTAGSREVQIFNPNQDAPFRRISRAAPVARRSLELVINRRMLQTEADLSEPGAVRIRMRTAFTSDKKNYLCSQSDWFSPLVPASPAHALQSDNPPRN